MSGTSGSDPEASAVACSMLRMALSRAGVTTDELGRRMTRAGFAVTGAGVRNRVSRGTFSAAFLLQALEVLQVSPADLSELWSLARSARGR